MGSTNVTSGLRLVPISTRGRGQVRALATLMAALGVLTVIWALAAAPANAGGPQSLADLAERLQPAVVTISTRGKARPKRRTPLPRVPKGSPFEEFFDDFFKRHQNDGSGARPVSVGSGFVVDASGLIVTNNHVIAESDDIIVTLSSGERLEVEKVIGRDSKMDLALLKVQPKKPLMAVRFGDSTKIRVGDWVMAIGNPLGVGATVTVGVVSAKKRDINSGPYDEFIQTDAAINKGNSGGPLFNMSGEVIGVNTAIISPTGGSIGLGFAIPANSAKFYLEQLKRFGKVARGYLGVRIRTVTKEIAESHGLDEAQGAFVASVTPKSPADLAGIKAGDIILSFDAEPVNSMRLLPKLVARTAIDQTVTIELLRKGERKAVKVTITELVEGEPVKQASLTKKVPSEAKEVSILGLSVSELSARLRKQFQVQKQIEGVVITHVEPGSVAAQRNLKPGDVIVEVTQEPVATPDDVKERVKDMERKGRKSVLLLVADVKGDMQFVALPIGQ